MTFMMFCSSAFAWELGETESYACFRELSKKPTKMTIYQYGDIHIHWGQQPTVYHFMYWSGDKLAGGGVWLEEQQYLDAKIKEWVEGRSSNADWTKSFIVSFDIKTKELSYGALGEKVSFQMNCISY